MTADEFIAVLSHELRGAVAAIGAAAQVLQDSDGTSAIAGEARAVVLRQSQRLASTLDDVQQLARLMAPDDRSRQDPVDLARLLQECDVPVTGSARPGAIRTDAALLQDAIARTVREAPSRLHATFEPDQEEAATFFTLEPVGGGFGVQFLRVLVERGGVQACVLQEAEGRRFVARLPN